MLFGGFKNLKRGWVVFCSLEKLLPAADSVGDDHVSSYPNVGSGCGGDKIGSLKIKWTKLKLVRNEES